MDKEETLLRALDKIQMNNEIAVLEYNVKAYEKINNQLTQKSKEIVEELVKKNAMLDKEKTKLQEQVNKLTMENNYLQKRMNKIPNFIQKIFSKDKTKLLNGGK